MIPVVLAELGTGVRTVGAPADRRNNHYEHTHILPCSDYITYSAAEPVCCGVLVQQSLRRDTETGWGHGASRRRPRLTNYTVPRPARGPAFANSASPEGWLVHTRKFMERENKRAIPIARPRPVRRVLCRLQKWAWRDGFNPPCPAA